MKTDLVGRGVAEDRVTVVPNGIDAALLRRRATPAEARVRLGLPVDGLWVGAVSSLVHYEGLEVLVTAVALARLRGLDVRAAIVGDGLAGPDLRRRVRALGLSDVVVLPGRLPRAQALGWLDALDVVAVPRLDFEVTRMVPPLKVAEAMGVGRPVVVSALPALAELVEDEVSGLVIPPGDAEALAAAVERLGEDVALRGRLTLAGREQAQRLTWASLTDRYQQVYGAVS